LIDAVHARVGSIEMVLALLAVAIFAARPRMRDAQEAGLLYPVTATLRIFELGEERTFEGTCPLTIGRDSALQLVLRDPETSRLHARLESQKGTVFLRDLESSNGTFLNGRKLESTIELREGDEVDVGTTRIVVESLRPWT
jgi:pSer/pThr/pTyr-binding forkhead associated (FHA) protein